MRGHVTAGLHVAFQTLLQHPAIRATLAVESYGAAELRNRTGPLLFLVGGGRSVDRAVALSGLPSSVRHRAVSVDAVSVDAVSIDGGRQTERLLADGWHVVLSAESAGAAEGAGREVAIAIQHRIPIVPVGVRGTFAAVEPGRLRPARGRPRIAVRYGLPLTPGAGETAPELAVRAERAIRELTAEDATTWWAVRRGREAGREVGAADPVRGGWRRTWRQSERPLLGGRQPPSKIWHG